MALLPVKPKYTDDEIKALYEKAVRGERLPPSRYTPQETAKALWDEQAARRMAQLEQQQRLMSRLHNKGGINDGMPVAPQPNFDLRQRGLYVPEGQPGALATGTPAATQPRMVMGGDDGRTIPLTNQQFASGILRGMANQGGRVMIPQASGAVTNTPLFVSATPAANAPTGITPEMKYQAGLGSNIKRNQYAAQKQFDSRWANELEIRKAVNQRKLAENVIPAEVAGQAKVAEAMINKGLKPDTGQPLPGANKPEAYTRGKDGLWRDDKTGKPAPEHVAKRLEIEKRKQDDIDNARYLKKLLKTRWLPWTLNNLYGMDIDTGDFRVFGSPKALDRARKTHLPLSPEQIKAMEEGPIDDSKGDTKKSGLSSAMPQQTTSTSTSGDKASYSSVQARVKGLQDPKDKKIAILGYLALGEITPDEARRITAENGLK